jgi:NAD-dependent dihydropyrimidine dehydrogenase PreA subunit
MTPERPGSSSENQLQLNAEKARRAARHPNRPGEKCAADAGAYQPVIDRNACEGKRDCVEVCPYGVFEVRRINDEDFSGLSFLGKLKSRAHGRLSAYTPQANLCQACGLCVVACPEKAITLVANQGLLGELTV